MHKEHGRSRHGPQHLARFRTALEGMGLFVEPYGPPPELLEEEDGDADRVVAAARRSVYVVGNMCRERS